MVKLLENTFGVINIELVERMALMCDRMGINVWEVIDVPAKGIWIHAVLSGTAAGRTLRRAIHRASLKRFARIAHRPGDADRRQPECIEELRV